LSWGENRLCGGERAGRLRSPETSRGTRKDYDRNPFTISYPPKALIPVTSRPTARV
jgi:hypothetical protein